MEEKFGKMKVSRGKKHTFVGMDFTLIGGGKVEILMKSYIEECIDTFKNVYGVLEGRAPTPGKYNLFEINENETKLGEEKADIFHQIVLKLLFVSKRARLDIEVVISFLCTRVDKSTMEDWLKLSRLLLYLKTYLALLERNR